MAARIGSACLELGSELMLKSRPQNSLHGEAAGGSQNYVGGTSAQALHARKSWPPLADRAPKLTRVAALQCKHHVSRLSFSN